MIDWIVHDMPLPLSKTDVYVWWMIFALTLFGTHLRRKVCWQRFFRNWGAAAVLLAGYWAIRGAGL